ncbi:MAG: hypothetical protein WCN98_09880 [Verrucomicrobiaceae bacterium]
MYFQFLSDGSDFRSRGSGGELARERRSNGMFWWTILITLLLGTATFSWIFSIMVFKYPEKPFNYRLLTKLKKLEPVEEFDPVAVPRGDFLDPKKLLSKYFYLNSEQLRVKNDLLKRAYILNYKDESPDYVKGTFTVISSRPLDAKDVMESGWVVRAKSVEIEDVEVEVLFPGKDEKKSPYQTGQTFTLDSKSTFAALLHVGRNSNDAICATIVSIVYGEFALNGEEKIQLSPPDKLNMAAHWPVMDASESSPNSVAKVAVKADR